MREEIDPTEPTRPIRNKVGDRERWITTWRYTDASGERKKGLKQLGYADEINERQALLRWQDFLLERREASQGKSASSPLKIGVICWRYYRHSLITYRKDGRPTSSAWNVKCAMKALRNGAGGLEGDQMNAPRLAKIRDALAGRGDLGKGLAAKTINEWLRIIRKAFDWARERGWVREGIARDLESVSGAKAGRGGARKSGKVRPVDEGVALRTANAMPPTLKTMIEILILNGWRPEEVCSMRRGELSTNGDIWEYRPSHKLEHLDIEAIRLIGPKTQALLKPYLNRRPDAFLFSPKEAIRFRAGLRDTHRRPDQKPDARKTDREVGDCYTTETFRRAIHRACTSIGVARWNPNQLRHLRATSLRAKFGLEATSAFLGHLNLSTTEIYAEKSIALALRIAKEEG